MKTAIILNFDGFNKESRGGDLKLNTFSDEYQLEFRKTTFNFKLENEPITHDMCVKENFSQGYFGRISSLFFLTEVIYHKHVCPFVFFNSQVRLLTLAGITNSLLFKNELSFMALNKTDSFSTLIAVLQLNINYVKIDQSILSVHLFRNLNVIFISGIIYNIDRNLFTEFNSLKSLILNPSDLGRFFRQDNLDWVLSLNYNLRKVNLLNSFEVNNNRLSKLILQIFETKSYFKKGYSYPDEDFCVFKNFPHNKLIYPSIVLADDEFECSCTIYWLIQYSNFYMNKNFSHYDRDIYSNYPEQFNASSARNCLKSLDLKEKITMCEFEARLKKCNLTNTENALPYRGNINSFFVFQWLKYIFKVYFQTSLCLLGIFTNLLLFLVVKKKEKPLDKSMYRHIYFNSIFNFFICLFSLISLVNVCIFPTTSFCSSIMPSQLSQYFKIYMVFFLLNSLRLMSNISYICFSLSRLFLSTSSSTTTNKFERLNFRKFYLILFIVCLLFSSFKIFEYKLNKDFGLTKANFPFNTYESAFCVYDLYFLENHLFRCKFFEIMNVINNTVNNIVIFLINICIDFLLLRFIRMKIKKKKKAHLGNKDSEANLSQDKKTKKKVTRLLIVNAFMTFFTRVPSFGVTIWLMAHKNEISEFCFYYFSCQEIIDMAQVFELVFVCFQFYILKFFDKNISLEYHALISRLIKGKH